MPLKLYRRGAIWHYRGTVGPAGRRQKLRGSTHTSQKDIAARQVAEIEKRYWDGHFSGPSAIVTFRQACDQFLADGRNAVVGRFDALSAARDHFKDTPVKDITARMIRDMAMQIYGHCTNASKNRLGIGPTQAVINHCAERELCDPIRVKRFPPQHKEKVPATLGWVQSFGAAASPHLAAYPLFMFLTGARPSEALAINPDRDLDLKRGIATIRMTKVEKDRKVEVTRTPHLPPMLVAALGNLEPVPGRPLFVYRKYGDMRDTWKAVAARAEIEALTPHCCRHGFATELLRRGVDAVTVAWLGGWASPQQVFKTYGHALKDRALTNMLVTPTLRAAFDDVTHDAIQAGRILAGYTDADLAAELARRAHHEHSDDDDSDQVLSRIA